MHELIKEENDPSLNLRVYIRGGGCSGFEYGFTFDDQLDPSDVVVEKTILENIGAETESKEGETETDAGTSTGSTVRLVIDPMSFQYLQGAEIDYVEDLQGAQFVIRNPNAKTTCGCGSSFSV